MHSKLYYRRLRPNFFRLGLNRRSKNRSLSSSKNLRKIQSESILKSNKNPLLEAESFLSPNSPNEQLSKKSNKKNLKQGKLEKKTHAKNKFSVCRVRNESKIEPTKSRSNQLVRKSLLGLFKKKSLKMFYSEFFEVFDSVDMSCTGFLNYSLFCKLLSRLHFIQDSFNKSKEETELVLKAWKCLGGLEDGKVKVEEVYLFLLGILDSKAGVTLRNLKKDKKSMVSLPPMCQINLHDEFLRFYKNRTNPKEEISDAESEKITEISIPQVIIDKPLDDYSKILEQDEIILNESFENSQCNDLDNAKVRMRINLRELAQTPNPTEKVNLYSTSFCDTPKNSSFHESEIENASQRSELSSDRSIGSFIRNFHIKKVKVDLRREKSDYERCISYKIIREDREGDTNEINRSSSYKFPAEKNGNENFHESSTLSNSKFLKPCSQKFCVLKVKKCERIMSIDENNYEVI
jgi:hypothetical protein